MSIFDDLVNQPPEKEPEGNPTFQDQAALLSNLAHVPADVGGFVGDIVTEGGKALVKRFRPDIQDPDFTKPSESDTVHLPGFGDASKIFQKLTDKVVPRQPASGPVTQGLSDFTELAAALAAGGGEATLPQILKTAAGAYGGSKLADYLAPGSEMAQFLGGLAGGVGPHILEGGVRSAVSARNIVNGASHPDFPTLVSMVQDRERGGTYANPKVNLKSGAMGLMQVTPETARQPGYGIRPWDGKSQEDLARVGTQKLAALMTKYGGDTQKAFAAYNWGEGHVDHAVATYGDNWVAHAPAETQKYIKGVSGPTTPVSPEPLGQPSLVAEEQPSTADQALTNALLAPHSAEPDVLTPAERQDMDASVPKQTPPEAVDARTVGQGADYPEQTPANDTNIVSLDQARDEKSLKDFHADLMSKVSDGAEVRRRLAQEAHDSGLLPMNVGDRFLTPKAQETGQGPWKVVGHFVDPKDPERYGYYAERGHEGADDHERGLLLVSDPKADAKLAEMGHVYDRQADVSQWKRLGIIQSAKDMLGDDSGALDLGKIFGQRKKPYDEAGPDGSAFDGLTEEGKLAKAIRTLRPANADQVEANRQARSEKFAYLDKLQQEQGGLEGFKQQAAALRGSIPKVDYESISHHFSPEERDSLLNKIAGSRTLRPAERFKAQQSLLKMLNPEGTVLPNKSELKLLSKVLHDQTVEALNAKVLAPDHVGLLEKLWNTVNAAKTIGDWSDLTKSNATMFLTPGYWKTIGNFVRGGFFKEGSYQNIRNATRANPDYDLVKQMGISHTGKGEAMNQHEEIFKTNLLEHVPGLSHVMNASERVYSGVANEVRDHAALRLIAKDRAAGIDVEDPAYLKQAGELINTLTGRASFGRSKLGVAVERGMPFISKVLWTPRQYASWVKMAGYAMNPKFWINASPAMRMQLATGFLSLTAWTASNLAIASSLGYEVHKNVLDPLFGKWKAGDTTYDGSAGRGSTLHAIATALSGYVMKDGQLQSLGDNPHANMKSRGDVVMHWMRTHASPAAALIENEFEGKDLQHPVNAVGDKQDWANTLPLTRDKETTVLGQKVPVGFDWDKWKHIQENPILSSMVPMSAEGTIEAGQHYGRGTQTGLTGIGEMLGIQANTQEPRPAKASKKGGDPFDNLVNSRSKDDPFDSLVNPKKSQDVFNKLVSK